MLLKTQRVERSKGRKVERFDAGQPKNRRALPASGSAATAAMGVRPEAGRKIQRIEERSLEVVENRTLTGEGQRGRTG